jgi:hypothetical protein
MKSKTLLLSQLQSAAGKDDRNVPVGPHFPGGRRVLREEWRGIFRERKSGRWYPSEKMWRTLAVRALVGRHDGFDSCSRGMTGLYFLITRAISSETDALENVIFQSISPDGNANCGHLTGAGSIFSSFSSDKLRQLARNRQAYWLGHFMLIDAINYCEAADVWLKRHKYWAKSEISMDGVTLQVSTWHSISCWDVGRKIYGVWRIWYVGGIAKIQPLLAAKQPLFNVNPRVRFRFFDGFRKSVSPGLSDASLSFYRRRISTFYENIPASLCFVPSECLTLSLARNREVIQISRTSSTDKFGQRIACGMSFRLWIRGGSSAKGSRNRGKRRMISEWTISPWNVLGKWTRNINFDGIKLYNELQNAHKIKLNQKNSLGR